MMGGHHAISGTAGALALAGTTGVSLGAIDVGSGMSLASFAAMVTGAALLPDADHHNATIAHSLPKLGPLPSPSEIICRMIGKISGGHRHGTHSIIGIAAFVALAMLLGQLRYGGLAIGAAIMGFVLTSFALKALKLSGPFSVLPWGLSLAVAGFVMKEFDTDPFMLPLAVSLGCAIHIVGDMATTDMCPILYPLNPKAPKGFEHIPVLGACWNDKGSFGFPILGNAGSTREWILCLVFTGYVLLAATTEAGIFDPGAWATLPHFDEIKTGLTDPLG